MMDYTGLEKDVNRRKSNLGSLESRLPVKMIFLYFSRSIFHEIFLIIQNFVGRKIHLNVITRGEDEIHRYYHLHSAEIPIRPMEEYDLANFVKTLLILRVCYSHWL